MRLLLRKGEKMVWDISCEKLSLQGSTVIAEIPDTSATRNKLEPFDLKPGEIELVDFDYWEML